MPMAATTPKTKRMTPIRVGTRGVSTPDGSVSKGEPSGVATATTTRHTRQRAATASPFTFGDGLGPPSPLTGLRPYALVCVPTMLVVASHVQPSHVQPRPPDLSGHRVIRGSEAALLAEALDVAMEGKVVRGDLVDLAVPGELDGVGGASGRGGVLGDPDH